MTALNVTSLYAIARTLGGIPVLGCVPGSKSERGGVRYGDIVLAVNGAPVRDMADFVRLRSRNTTPMRTVEVFRDGERMLIELPLDGEEVTEDSADQYMAERGDLMVASAATPRVDDDPV